MEKIEVELHSIEASAVEATRNTLRMMGADLEERNGRFYVVTDNPRYMRFAVEHQGYVKKVLP